MSKYKLRMSDLTPRKKKKYKLSPEGRKTLKASGKAVGRANVGLTKDQEKIALRKKKYCSMIMRDIHRGVKNNFSAWCKLNGTNMRADLEDYMRRRGNEIGVGQVQRTETKRGRMTNGRAGDKSKRQRAYVHSVPDPKA